MKIGHIIIPAGDMDAQIAFYSSLGLTTRFQDGHRYAAMTDGTVTIGLAADSEQPVAGRVVMTIEVDDLDATLAALEVDVAVVEGPHERRAVLLDAAGQPVVLYTKRSV